MVPRTLLVVLVSLLLLAAQPEASGSSASPPSPPTQPADGPGGSSVRYSGVRTTQAEQGPDGYWLLVPTDGDRPVLDQSLPLVIFLHGFSAVDPVAYGAWLDHIVQHGAIVIYPSYQAADAFVSGTDRYLANTQTAVRAAVARLRADSLDAIDLDRVALAGHSVGGWLAAQYALTAADAGLPVPTALLSMMPGGCGLCGSVAAALQIPSDLSGELDPDTHALLFGVTSDPVVGTGASDRIWRSFSQLPADQRDRLVLSSDAHGEPPLVAEHNTPQTIIAGQPDAFDYGVTWKLFDALMSCSFDGTDCDTALGGGAAQTSIGRWSDGQPVVPLTESDTTP